MATEIITRRSHVGFGYSPATYDDTTPPDYPTYKGTVRQVLEKIENDYNLKSMSNTLLSKVWFVNVSGRWVPVKNAYPEIARLTMLVNKGGEREEYICDSIEVEVEI